MFSKLNQKSILGINARIGDYILPNNPRENYPRVDDKVLTAELAQKYEIPVPKNYGVFERFGDLKTLGDLLSGYDDFVIKPARGAMGNGIIVITAKDREKFYKPSGAAYSLSDLRYHIQNTLSGLYSLNGYPDKAIVQYRIKLHESFQDIAFQGIPDIRVIVYKGYPVMAMTRLPTSTSDGRANLHQGAIGVGIDIKTGRTTHAVLRTEQVANHTDTGVGLTGFDIPFWNEILLMSTRGYEMTGLGYLGVDVAIDAEQGPLVIEMNARPGLAIQIANHQGILDKLKQVDNSLPRNLSPQERLAKILE